MVTRSSGGMWYGRSDPRQISRRRLSNRCRHFGAADSEVRSERAVIYARCYTSDDFWTETSIDLQLAACSDFIVSQPWTLVGKYWDDDAQTELALSRHAVAQLVEDAERGNFDVVVTRSLNRISHDQRQVAVVCDCMRCWRVKIVTLAEGLVDLDAEAAALSLGEGDCGGTLRRPDVKIIGEIVTMFAEGRTTAQIAQELAHRFTPRQPH